MKILTMLFAVIGILFSTALFAQVERKCTPMEEIKAPEGWTILAPLTTKEIALTVELSEALTGVDDSFNFALFAEHADGRGVILLGRDGTICGTIGLTPEQWLAFKKSVLGVEA